MAKSIIVDERIDKEIELSLKRLGFFVIRLPMSSLLPDAIGSHPDSLILKLGEVLISYSSYVEDGLSVFSDVREYHRNIRLSFVSEEPGKEYPSDCRLNALVAGDRLFARLDSLANGVRETAERQGLRLINTRQGYPACSTLMLDESHAVTADRGLGAVLESEGIKVLLISSGGISLPPYEYGFIGGASFVYKDAVYFFGDLSSHPDGERIRAFLSDAGYEAISLSQGALFDYGGAVILE